MADCSSKKGWDHGKKWRDKKDISQDRKTGQNEQTNHFENVKFDK